MRYESLQLRLGERVFGRLIRPTRPWSTYACLIRHDVW